MRRGEIFTAATRDPYTAKPRPIVIIQDDRFDAAASIAVCPMTIWCASTGHWWYSLASLGDARPTRTMSTTPHSGS